MVIIDYDRGECSYLALEYFQTAAKDRDLAGKVYHSLSQDELEAKRILSTSYEAGSLSLVLGGGVSMSCGLPGWDQLVEDLFSQITFDALGVWEPEVLPSISLARNPAIAARVIRTVLGQAQTTELVRRAIYQHVKLQHSPLLKSISKLAARRDKRLNRILTFNYDDLVETELARLGIPHQVVSPAHVLDSKDKLAVYHLHGYLPRDGKRSSDIVLTEDQYHLQMSNPNYWSTRILLETLRSSNCLFLGLSMRDPQLRLILDQVWRERKTVSHVTILGRSSLLRDIDVCVDNDMSMNMNLRQRALAEVVPLYQKRLLSGLFEDFGVKVIWADSHEEYAGKVAQLADYGGSHRTTRNP